MKEQLRKQALELRKTLPLDKISKDIINNLFSLKEYKVPQLMCQAHSFF